MTPEEISKRSKEKVDQLKKLMMELSISVDAKERIDQNGFVERVVVFIDTERYSPVIQKEDDKKD